MSKFSLLCSLLVFAASAAKAVMIGWNLPAVDDAILHSEVYVYTSSTPVDAYSAGSKTWTGDGGGQEIFGQEIFVGKGAAYVSTLAIGDALATSEPKLASFSQTEGLSVWADLGDLASGKYYYLVFVANGIGDADLGTYAIAGAQYVTDKGEIKSPGFFNVEANKLPDYVGEFADLSWIAANHKSAPEPTVLALLALGFAGLALRRKIA